MQVKDKEKVLAIFDSTLDLVAKVGLSGVSMAMIAKESGIATGTIYIYFKNKEILFLELYKKIKNHFRTSVFGDYSPKIPVKDTLWAMWQGYIRFSVNNYREHIFLQQFNYSPFIHKNEALRFAQQIMQPLLAVIEKGKKQKLIKEDHYSIILHLLGGFVHQCVLVAQQDRSLLTEAFIESAFGYFWDAIRQ